MGSRFSKPAPQLNGLQAGNTYPYGMQPQLREVAAGQIHDTCLEASHLKPPAYPSDHRFRCFVEESFGQGIQGFACKQPGGFGGPFWRLMIENMVQEGADIGSGG